VDMPLVGEEQFVEAVINNESQYVRTTEVPGGQLTVDPATDLVVSNVQSSSFAYPYLKCSTSTKPVTYAIETLSTKHSRLTAAGAIFIGNIPQNNSDVSPLMVNVTVTSDEFLQMHSDLNHDNQHSNVKHNYLKVLGCLGDDEYLTESKVEQSQVKLGPDKEKWFDADENECSQMLDPPNSKMEEISDELAGVPQGERVLTIKRVC
jgi:hypothetical protein